MTRKKDRGRMSEMERERGRESEGEGGEEGERERKCDRKSDQQPPNLVDVGEAPKPRDSGLGDVRETEVRV